MLKAFDKKDAWDCLHNKDIVDNRHWGTLKPFRVEHLQVDCYINIHFFFFPTYSAFKTYDEAAEGLSFYYFIAASK